MKNIVFKSAIFWFSTEYYSQLKIYWRLIFGNVIRCSTLRYKDINRLISKGMSNIYLKLTIGKNLCTQNFDFLSSKKFFSRPVFGNLQLTQISLNFQNSCCNLKMRGLRAKLFVAFLLFSFGKELWLFKVK